MLQRTVAGDATGGPNSGMLPTYLESKRVGSLTVLGRLAFP